MILFGTYWINGRQSSKDVQGWQLLKEVISDEVGKAILLDTSKGQSQANPPTTLVHWMNSSHTFIIPC